VTDPSGRRILELLAKEEACHAEALEKMKGGDYRSVGTSSLLSEVKGVVEGAVKNGKGAISSDTSLRGILQKAMEIEHATRSFYKEMGSSATDPKPPRERPRRVLRPAGGVGRVGRVRPQAGVLRWADQLG